MFRSLSLSLSLSLTHTLSYSHSLTLSFSLTHFLFHSRIESLFSFYFFSTMKTSLSLFLSLSFFHLLQTLFVLKSIRATNFCDQTDEFTPFYSIIYTFPHTRMRQRRPHSIVTLFSNLEKWFFSISTFCQGVIGS
jgi:hypothetical protein